MRALLILSAIVLGIAWAASTSRSETSSGNEPTEPAAPEPLDEPITDEPSVANPGDESPARDSFTPYDIGPPEGAWSYEDLTVAEKAVADRGRNVDGWAETHNAFHSAVIQRSAEATASAAEQQLGADHLETIGVVP